MAAKKQKKETQQQEKAVFEEKPLETPQPVQSTGPKAVGAEKMPLSIIAMLIILAILAGAAITLTFFKPAPVTNDNDTNTINDVEYRTVPIIMLYSNECKSCRQTNTIEELFNVRNIAYTIRKVEASSQEGKELIAKYEIDTVPTAIIDAQKMEFYPTTKQSFDQKNTLIRKLFGNYVVPELNLNDNYYYPVYFLEKVGGFCDSTKPTVVQFDDYYTPESTTRRALLYDFIKDFNESTDIKFSYAQTQNSWDENGTLGNLFLMCASRQGLYPQLEREMTGIYCNNPFGGDEQIITDSETLGCQTLSNHYGKPLTQLELDRALSRTGSVDINSFVACIADRNVMINNAKMAIRDIGITRAAIFLIDCHETTHLLSLHESFCAIHPELEACKDDPSQ